MAIEAFIDGLVEPVNPGGIATYGVVIVENGTVIERFHGVVGEGRMMSNNVAEYAALNAAFQWLLDRKIVAGVTIKGDSKLVINQMRGAWQCHGGLYAEQYRIAVRLSEKFSSIAFTWIPRENNAMADAASREAYEERCKEKGIKPTYGDRKPRDPSGLPADRTCMRCKWAKESGPHVGCFKDGKYRKWIPRSDARSVARDCHEP